MAIIVKFPGSGASPQKTIPQMRSVIVRETLPDLMRAYRAAAFAVPDGFWDQVQKDLEEKIPDSAQKVEACMIARPVTNLVWGGQKDGGPYELTLCHVAPRPGQIGVVSEKICPGPDGRQYVSLVEVFKELDDFHTVTSNARFHLVFDSVMQVVPDFEDMRDYAEQHLGLPKENVNPSF